MTAASREKQKPRSSSPALLVSAVAVAQRRCGKAGPRLRRWVLARPGSATSCWTVPERRIRRAISHPTLRNTLTASPRVYATATARSRSGRPSSSATARRCSPNEQRGSAVCRVVSPSAKPRARKGAGLEKQVPRRTAFLSGTAPPGAAQASTRSRENTDENAGTRASNRARGGPGVQLGQACPPASSAGQPPAEVRAPKARDRARARRALGAHAHRDHHRHDPKPPSPARAGRAACSAPGELRRLRASARAPRGGGLRAARNARARALCRVPAGRARLSMVRRTTDTPRGSIPAARHGGASRRRLDRSLSACAPWRAGCLF